MSPGVMAFVVSASNVFSFDCSAASNNWTALLLTRHCLPIALSLKNKVSPIPPKYTKWKAYDSRYKGKKRRSRGQKILLFLVKCVVSLVLLLVAGLVGSYYWWVVKNPAEAVRPENITKILSMESPVYYSDATHKIGIFFEESHRQYVPFRKIPKNFVNAIVAAEDHEFFSHYGVDFSGLARAMLANIKARRVVQGGSTLTQQTAKNLFKRKNRSVKSKLKELLFALQLEHHFSKEQILEFYANQFYVSGNGKGLGVAARYYFNKDVSQLNLVEAAFIAGSVKRPNYYNPHIKKSEASVAKSRAASKRRTAYVLGQMYKLQYIDVNAYQRALLQEIPFDKGRTRFSNNTVMDLVKDGMADQAITEAFERHGIDNIATSGVRIITTIDRDIQQSSLYALKNELSRLDIRLSGYDSKALQKVYSSMTFGARQPLEKGKFFIGRIKKVSQNPPQVEVVCNSKGDEVVAVIDKKGLETALLAWVRYQRHRWSTPVAGDRGKLLKQLAEGELVYVSVRQPPTAEQPARLDLEKFPDVQGAVIARQNGRIRAMVGGMTNHFFNRAVAARRPMGSVIKPLVYAAAIQLGWNSVDLLENERSMFVFHGEPYFPRPDHISPYPQASMSWAGVHSENLATVWLLYHLCDRLTPGQFKELLSHLDMAPGPGESYPHYMRRIRDDLGVVVNQAALQRLAFEKARSMVESDLIFDGEDDAVEILRKFHFADYSQSLQEDEEQQKKKDKDKLSRKEKEELELRKDLTRYSFSRLQELHGLLERLRLFPDATIETFVPNLYYLPPENQEGGQDLSTFTFIFSDNPQNHWRPVPSHLFSVMVGGMLPADLHAFWQQVRIDDLLPAFIVEKVATVMMDELARLNELPPYSEEVLYAVHDFRLLAGLKYLIALCQQLGVESELEPVLSFPLGSNVISLYEVARIYEGLVTGQAYAINDSHDAGLDLISRIESHEGELIYSAQVDEKQVVDPQTSLAVSDILRNVVKYGTGRFAYRHIQLHSREKEIENNLRVMGITVPVLGKTGTANRFTNASFAGLIPGPHTGEHNGVALDKGLVLASYVGYDDNKPMVRRTTHITGSSGALPLWSKVAADYIYNSDYAKTLDLADLSFSGVKELPLFYPELGQLVVPVATQQGGRVLTDHEVEGELRRAPVVMFGETLPSGQVKPQRAFRPFWSQ